MFPSGLSHARTNLVRSRPCPTSSGAPETHPHGPLGDTVPELLLDTPIVETNYETAERIYLTRSPWMYDARFHVPREHIRWVPAFLAPGVPSVVGD